MEKSNQKKENIDAIDADIEEVKHLRRDIMEINKTLLIYCILILLVLVTITVLTQQELSKRLNTTLEKSHDLAVCDYDLTLCEVKLQDCTDRNEDLSDIYAGE